MGADALASGGWPARERGGQGQELPHGSVAGAAERVRSANDGGVSGETRSLSWRSCGGAPARSRRRSIEDSILGYDGACAVCSKPVRRI